MKTINRDILKLAVPSILANITVPIVGMVDIAVAGHLDVNAATMIGGIAIGFFSQWPAYCFITISQRAQVEKQFGWAVLSCDYATEKFFS